MGSLEKQLGKERWMRMATQGLDVGLFVCMCACRHTVSAGKCVQKQTEGKEGKEGGREEEEGGPEWPD